MNKIKFSHDYEKLPPFWEGTQAVLFGVQYINDMERFRNRYPHLILHDTKFRTEKGSYELNFKEGLLLVFYHLNSKTFFTTIRRFTPAKSEYYQNCEQEIFELVYTREEDAKP